MADEPSRAPYLSRGAGRATDRTETEGTSLAAAGQTERPPAPPGAVQPLCPPGVCGMCSTGGRRFTTVLRRPLSQGICPGGLPSLRFEDQTGLDVTSLFWLENVTVGVAHLCKGEF